MISLKAGYRHYSLLMNLAFWILLIGYGRSLLLFAGIPKPYLLAEWRSFNLAIGSLVLAVQFLLIVLILIRQLRDEYAEQLWQKAAASLIKLLSLTPFLWIAFHYLFLHKTGFLEWLRAHPDSTLIPAHALLRNPTDSTGIHQFEAISFMIIKFTQYFPLAFVALYRWHRWQDER